MKKIILISMIFLSLSTIANADNNSEFCKEKWGNNYRMVEHCLIKQNVSEIAVAYWAESDQFDNDIWNLCAEKWTDAHYVSNYRMINYCIKKQTAARARLEN